MVESCVGCMGKILGFLVEPAITHGAYVIRYKEKVDELKRTYNTLLEKKISIRDWVVEQENNGKVITGTEYSSWLKEVKRMELEIENNQNIANFLRQQKDEGRMKDDFLLQQMERNFLPRQGNGERMQRDFINFLIQQENGEQMEQDFANFLLHQQEDGESFRCFPGCMCPNLMWRYKRGKEAEKRKEEVTDLIEWGENLQNSLVARYAYSQSELPRVSSQYYTEFQSRASVVDRIMDALKSSEVHMIGVLGPGGIGKTTIVKEVAKVAMARGIFHEFVIAVVSKNQNNPEILKQLVSGLGLECEENLQRTALTSKLMVKNRKILVILDDLWQLLDLNDIGIPISGLGDRGFKILLTSRNEEVFRRMQVPSYVRLGYLEKQETWELFKKVIDGDFGVDESTARMVSERCGGLPIAIVAVGAALKGKDDCEWQDALNQLKNGRVKYIEGNVLEGYTPLKLSYDFLKEKDAKSCFLLCCLFPEDAQIPIDDLVRYSFALGFLSAGDTLKNARYRVQTMVNMLKRSCLLLDGVNKNFVKMHDVIRDIAISITKERQIEHDGGLDWPGQQHFMVDHNIRKWPKNDAWERYTAISLMINVDADIHFPYCPLMHTLVLKRGECSLEIPDDFFQGMKKARILDLENISMDLPSSVLELDHLRMLRLNNCHYLRDLSTIQNLKNHIEILSFEGSEIRELPQEIGKLTCLRSLNLRKCDNLKVISKGVISNLIHLEELYVTLRFKNWDTTTDGGISNASIGELKSLNKLTILHVGISTNSYRIMAEECRHLFGKLINFSILINCDLSSGNESPNVLEIDDIDDTHDEFCLLIDRVEKLRLCNIQGLRYLHGNPQLHFTSSGGRSFCKLIDLHISGCHSMKYLFPPSCPKAFQQLKTLQVYNCRRMEQIIGGVGDHCNENEVITEEAIIFSRLERINLSKLPQFRSFYPKMEKTTIEENLSNWTTTTESIFNEKIFFPVLEDLTIDELSVKDIWSKQMIQSPKGSNKVSFSQLRKIEVFQCCNLVIFPKIENVCLNDLKSSREIQLWDLLTTTQEYRHTVSISIFGCQVSTNVLSHHQKRSSRMIVNNLLLWDCQGFEHVIDLNGTINIGEEQFVDVKRLTLYSLPELVLLWNKNLHEIGSLRSLKAIIIENCSHLRSLFMHFMATTLQHLEKISVTSCEMMEEIIIIEENNINFAGGEKATCNIEFPKLQRLFLHNLPNLKNFCNDERGSFSFLSLRSIKVKCCPKMKTFASGQVCLPQGMIRVRVGDEMIEITDLNVFFESRNEDNKLMKIIVNRGDGYDEGEYESHFNTLSEDDSDVDFARLW